MAASTKSFRNRYGTLAGPWLRWVLLAVYCYPVDIQNDYFDSELSRELAEHVPQDSGVRIRKVAGESGVLQSAFHDERLSVNLQTERTGGFEIEWRSAPRHHHQFSAEFETAAKRVLQLGAAHTVSCNLRRGKSQWNIVQAKESHK